MLILEVETSNSLREINNDIISKLREERSALKDGLLFLGLGLAVG